MKIYKVSEISQWGHDGSVKYFRNPIAAEKDFHRRVKEGITSKDLPTRDNMDGSPPWKVRCDQKFRFKEKIKLQATIHFWDSYHTDCGTEYDISNYDIQIEEIEVE
ncbi:hypothetical protein BVG16_13435 [Paenibacillus selenitireducens]|uniref:Uncharacterized protein n=1 Tax=Paenibacillus selenitireducens TaxID=1324314 RepID=A0A1T2XC26_9BACL|nr:hypothetical protein [Paenibacillus selenitireducens]OPA77454.1 hypothetical protein BVG16_13435 [Paenibacillus selenitireducens]